MSRPSDERAERASRRRPGWPAALASGALVTAGWLAADLSMFANRGAVDLAGELAPEALVLLALGALLGAVLSHPGAIALALAATGAATAFSLAARLPLSPTGLASLRVGFLWLSAVAAARFVAPRVGRSTAACALGALAAVAQTTLRFHLMEGLGRALVAALALGLGGLLLGRALRSPAPARAGWTLALLAWLLLPAPAASARLADLRRADLPRGAAAAGPARPHLLLIVLDTVRADRTSAYGHARTTTPELESFVRSGAVRYTQARSTSSWTLPSHASLFTGRLPAEHGATHARGGGDTHTLERGRNAVPWPAQPLPPELPTLAERLRAAGYDTAAVFANPLYLRHEFGLDRGFARYDDRDPPALPHDYWALPQLLGRRPWLGKLGYRDATAITELAFEWLDELRDPARPFFLALNYMDAHMPYLPPAPFDRAFTDERPELPLRPAERLHALLYDRELAYLDAQVGRLLAGLVERGLASQCAVVITSDHGEAFGEHGYWRHDWALYDELVRVPLLVRAPGASPQDTRDDDTPLNGAEVHDLLLGLVALEPERRASADLTAEWYQVADPTAWELRFGGIDLERDLVTWIEQGTKWIVSSTGQVEAFDLATDPRELAPLALEPAAHQGALERAAAWWRTHPPPELTRGELDDGLRQRMSQLGYAGGDERPPD